MLQMKAYTKYKEEMQMKKATKCLLGGALLILLLTPVSQVKADWHQDNVGWWYSLNNGSYYKTQKLILTVKAISLMIEDI